MKKGIFGFIVLIALFFTCVGIFGKDIIKVAKEEDSQSQESLILESTISTPDFFTLEEIQQMEAGSIVEESFINDEVLATAFYSTGISEEIKQRIWNVSYKEDAKIALEELCYVRVLHRNFDNQIQIGELIVHQSIAEDILDIFYELFQNEYPIEKILLVDEYNADDVASMSDNNTSAFNYRVIAGTNKLSKHAMGLAIDINPKYNPYVAVKTSGEVIISPQNGMEYANRDQDFSYKLDEHDLCVKLFLEHEFTWGGNWKYSKDYQHFEF